MTTAIVFPGQGSQTVGMGKSVFDAYPEARQIFEAVDDALEEKLSTIIFEGPEEALNMTENTQPALMAVSIACLEVIKAKTGKELEDLCGCVAGHSLGEYTALTATGALDVYDTARLLKLRGQSMQNAVEAGGGAMLAVLGLTIEEVQELAEKASNENDGAVCQMANDNCPGQIVLSGAKNAIETAAELAKDMGAKRALILPVSVPAHSALMQPAADIMREALADTVIKMPVVPVYANVTANIIRGPEQINDLLIKQLTGSVRWRETITSMTNGTVDTIVEIGAGKVLTGLTRRINKDIKTLAIGDEPSIEAFVEQTQSKAA